MVRYVEIVLDRPRRLRFDINALADLEETLGGGLATLFSGQQVGIRTLRALLWAGLRWEDPGLTIPGAGLLGQHYLEAGQDLGQLGELLREALTRSGLVGEPKNQPEAKGGILPAG